MSDFLSNLVARSLGRAAVVEPRRPSIFEPVRSGLIAPVEGSLSSEEKAEWAGESVEEIEVPRFEFSRPSRRESRGLANTEHGEADDRFASKSVPIDRKQSRMSQVAQQLAEARHGNAKDRFALKAAITDTAFCTGAGPEAGSRRRHESAFPRRQGIAGMAGPAASRCACEHFSFSERRRTIE